MLSRNMSITSSQVKGMLHRDGDVSAITKRKLRKGTFSCWPCKKRKTRCVFAEDASLPCLSCKKRGIKCISQELDESFNDEREAVSQEFTSIGRPLLPMIEKVDDLVSRCRSLTLHLYSLMPDPARAAEICTRGGFSRMPFQCGRQPPSPDSSGVYGPMLPSGSWKCPAAPSSPLEQARSLVYLALCLQQLDQENWTTAGTLTTHDAKSLASHYMDAASTFVTSQERFVNSVDGVHLLLLETLYHVNAGDLRASWLLTCRALTMSAFLLDSNLDPKQITKLRRLHRNAAQGEQYFALLLGLNVDGTSWEPCTTDAIPVEACVDQLELSHQAVLQRLVSRNRRIRKCLRDNQQTLQEVVHHQTVATSEIDSDLRAARGSMPLAWWATPALSAAMLEVEVMQATGKLILQSHHFFMAMMTHQPSFLVSLVNRSIKDKSLDLGSALCVAASRDTLRCFNAIRQYHTGISYGGSDDKAYIAAAVILLTHIAAGNKYDQCVLEYERANDLSLVRDAHETLTKALSKDDLLRGYVRDLSQLLVAEANVAEGSCYDLSLVQDAAEAMANSCSDHHFFDLRIPYFGTLRGIQSDVSAALRSQPWDLFEAANDSDSISRPTAALGCTSGLPGEELTRDLLGENVAVPLGLAFGEFDWAVDPCANYDDYFTLAQDSQIPGTSK